MRDKYFGQNPISPLANIGRQIRESLGEVHGDLDERMLELVDEPDFAPFRRSDD